jgi:CRP-like cAMP-binding protein
VRYFPAVNVSELQDLPVFAGLSADELARVADASERREYPAGEQIVRIGEFDDTFFAILSGSVRVTRGGSDLATMSAGEFFGETGALDSGPGYAFARTANVSAVTDVTVAALPGKRFTELFASNPEVRDRIVSAMSDRGM